MSAETAGTADVVVQDEGDRFAIVVDGVRAGFTLYTDRDRGDPPPRVFPHTEVDERFQGRGLATQLIKGALDATREAGRSVIPMCPAVKGYIVKHPDEYADLVPEARHAEFGLA